MVILRNWISGQQRHINGRGGGGGGSTRYSAIVNSQVVIFTESTIISFVELVKVMRIIAFLFEMGLIYKKLLRGEVYYIIYSTLITY